MTDNVNLQIQDLSSRQAALAAGSGLLGMFIFSLFATGPGPIATFSDILSNPGLIRRNITGDILMLACDVIAGLGLYAFLRPANDSLAKLSAWFRLMHVAVYGAAAMMLFLVLQLTALPAEVSASEQVLNTVTAILMNGHDFGFRVGLVFFGFHFAVLGYLGLKSRLIPKAISVLILISTVGYLANSFIRFLVPGSEVYRIPLDVCAYVPAALTELALCLWLLLKGGRRTARNESERSIP